MQRDGARRNLDERNPRAKLMLFDLTENVRERGLMRGYIVRRHSVHRW
jgi:hypothetical protein